MDAGVLEDLEQRLGRVHARQRLGLEADHEARARGGGLNFFRVENWYSVQAMIRRTLKVSGLYPRGLHNARRIRVRENVIARADVPPDFDGFTLLQISDLHADMNERPMARLGEIVETLDYDLCVLTGDYRGRTYGPFEPALEGLARLRPHLRGPVWAVLGNHDSIRMVPGIEGLDVRMLLNECAPVTRNGSSLFVAGIDDAHYYRAGNIEKAAAGIPPDGFSILLSHTPEVYRRAAHAGVRVLLSGHTHGGQICLPRGVPLTLGAALPRRLGAGAWRYHDMDGYTSVGVGSSVVPVRFNCPPEATLHRLVRTQG